VIVFFDTNVLVSTVATRGLCADIVNAALAGHELIVGETVLAELRQVLRQKLRLPATLVDEMDAFLRQHARVVRAAGRPDVQIRDIDDQTVLAEAMAGKADVLVTGDQDLLEVAAHAPLKILSPRGFWELLRES
jgi:putative PIN family toxin of toxin-antitoxin system